MLNILYSTLLLTCSIPAVSMCLFFFQLESKTDQMALSETVSEYDQEIPQSRTADKP